MDKEYGRRLAKAIFEMEKNPNIMGICHTKKRNAGYKTAQLEVEKMRKLLTPTRWWRLKYWFRWLPDRIKAFFRK
jgi:hypothetical protein